MTPEEVCVYVEKIGSDFVGYVPPRWSEGGSTDLALPEDWPDPKAKASHPEARISGSIEEETLTIDLRDQGHKCRFVWNLTTRSWERETAAKPGPTSRPSTQPAEQRVNVQLPVHQGLDGTQSFLAVAVEHESHKPGVKREVQWHFLLMDADESAVEEICMATTSDDHPIGGDLRGMPQARTTAVLARDQDDHPIITLTDPSGSTAYKPDLTGKSDRWLRIKPQ